MTQIRRYILALICLCLSGCGGLLGTASSSSSNGDGSGYGGRDLSAYRLAHARGTASSTQANPLKRPRTIEDHDDYPFNNAIPFFPRGRGEMVTSDFGWRMLWGGSDFHCGVDVAAKAKTRVRAVTSGQVTFTRSAGPNGGLVVFNGGRQYTYWHMLPHPRLEAGSRVRAGQTLGYLADWGSNTHLHYALNLTGRNANPNARKPTNCVDPMALARRGLY